MARLTLRLDFADDVRIGPGKIRLLEEIQLTGSISAAGRALGMSYRRAWLLIDALNHMFREPLVVTKLGGKAGGGAGLTRWGERVVVCYRKMEADSASSAMESLQLLEAMLRPITATQAAGGAPRAIAADERETAAPAADSL